ncbi:MAG: hypothetical protein J6T15_05300 [Bacilli bacterium]|nr:hypothetical protein [Bacilli bacterium]
MEDIKESVDNETLITIDSDKSLMDEAFTEIDLDERLSAEPGIDAIPDTVVSVDPFIEEREKLKVGLTPEDIKNLYSYISGEGEKPLFLDKFASDSEGRLKDMILIMQLIQLSRLPMLTALQSQVQERLFSKENLYAMDLNDLTKASGAITREVETILKTSTEAIQTITQFGTLNSEYRKLIDAILLLSEDKLNRIKEIVYTE